ncbi:UDP-N-acetylmuramoyl-L-alanine--D-glutamate ligase [Salinimonas lutimaris]|uniref:UDP-N-acetylmuramoyl-L-alanine--D-glutamate ligase n=1 Tax=Salinimonas lutimaris TaxID=914153 RepID=UPI001E384E4F|nr:UDP-N-acetylmuramoyl-L-alanine--D-glutamate ligase [Salinimonas lutimaris]
MMSLQLAGQRIVVAGLGISGQASIRFLLSQQAQLKVWDTRADAPVPDDITCPVVRGALPQGYWDDVTTLVVSPGIDLQHEGVQQAMTSEVEVIGEIELFARINTRPCLGITGSNGKTTVTLLLTHILNSCGIRAVAAGNVGKPALSTLDDDVDMVVLELSSFQLETTSSLALEGATLLNLSDDHLDRHKTMAAYSDAKQRIFNHATQALCWREQQLTYPLSLSVQVHEFGLADTADDFGFCNNMITWQGKPLLDISTVQLVGTHNILNIQAAIGLAMCAGVEASAAAAAVATFAPVAHRCVTLPTSDKIRWIDDSKATNAGATIAALTGLGAGKTGRLILIAGGDGKGADFAVLTPYLHQYVDELITLGKDGPALAALKSGAYQVANMPEAVEQARALASPGDIVLMSPACASLDMFKNYVHRAEVFAQAVAGGAE